MINRIAGTMLIFLALTNVLAIIGMGLNLLWEEYLIEVAADTDSCKVSYFDRNDYLDRIFKSSAFDFLSSSRCGNYVEFKTHA